MGKFARVIRYYMIWLVVLNYSHFRIWQSKYVILQEMRIDAAQMATSQNCLCQELEFYQWDFVDFKSPIRSFNFKLFIGIEILPFFSQLTFFERLNFFESLTI